MRFLPLLLAVCLLGAGFRTYEPQAISRPLQIPATPHCTVTLLHARPFAGDAPRFATFAPPGQCPGPWSRVVLTWRTRISGRQYDRVGELFIGRHEVFRFTTAEPTRHGIDYTVKSDLTRYAPFLHQPQSVVAELANYVNKRYDGVYVIDANLTFYQAGPHAPAATQADAILPIENESGAVPAFDLQKPQDRAATTLRDLPRNIVHAQLEVYSTQHGCDEFWYTNQSDAFAARHKGDQLCGGGAYREIDVYVDGRMANVIYPFPWIYTGGINPMLWRPIASIDALNVPPYRVDLDPFAGVLSDGKPHTIAIGVLNDRGDWITDANLFLTEDRKAARTSGAIANDTLEPMQDAPEKVTPAGASTRFHTTASRAFHVEGYVTTSQGRVVHGITSTMSFTNAQLLNLHTGRQDAAQTVRFTTITTTKEGARPARTHRVTASYPLIANSVYSPVKRGAKYDLQISAYVVQERNVTGDDGVCRDRIVANATYKRAKTEAASVAHGHTEQVYHCTGKAGSFTIHKIASDGDVANP